MKCKLSFTAMTLLLALGIGSSTAYGDTIFFSLNTVTQTANVGSTLTYTATVSADPGNGGDVFLNGYQFYIDAPLTLNGNDFYSNAPFFLVPGESESFDIFTVTLPSYTPVGFAYSGYFTIVGGSDGGAQDPLATTNFSIATASTPEPSSVLLLGSGMTGLLSLVRRKRNR